MDTEREFTKAIIKDGPSWVKSIANQLPVAAFATIFNNLDDIIRLDNGRVANAFDIHLNGLSKGKIILVRINGRQTRQEFIKRGL